MTPRVIGGLLSAQLHDNTPGRVCRLSNIAGRNGFGLQAALMMPSRMTNRINSALLLRLNASMVRYL